MDLKEVQRRLTALKLFDGEVGAPAAAKATDAALMALFRWQQVRGWDHWSFDRRVIAGGQVLARIDGIDPGEIDGLKGPQTTHAFDVYEARAAAGGKPVAEVEAWRDAEDAKTPPPATSAKAVTWPRQNYADMIRFFGAVGTHQVTLELPYPMRVAWNLGQTIRTTSCHALCEEPMKRALGRALEHYGIDRLRELRLDLFGGLLNVRKKRGGSTWSMHAWGIALDIDPERNALKMGRDKATLDGPDYEPWWQAWEAEGAVSLGRARNFDWMHVQFARL